MAHSVLTGRPSTAEAGHGVSAYPAEVTAAMLANSTAGNSSRVRQKMVDAQANKGVNVGRELRSRGTKPLRLLFPASWAPEHSLYSESMTQMVGEWLAQTEVLSSETAQIHNGYSFGWTNFGRGLIVTKILMLWILFDDAINRSDRDYWQRHRLSVQDHVEALRGVALAPGAGPFLRAWYGLGEQLAHTRSWREQFAHDFGEWLEASLREFEASSPRDAPGRLPELDTYLNSRTLTVGVQAMYHLVEFALGFELPEAAWCSREVNELHDLGSRSLLLANDIYRLERDLTSGRPNVVLVLQAHYGISLQEALEQAVLTHNECVARFDEIAHSLSLFGPEADLRLREYVRQIQRLIRGLAEFAMLAERYQWMRQLSQLRRPIVATFCDHSPRLWSCRGLY